MNKLVVKALAPVIQRSIDETGKLLFAQLKCCVDNCFDINSLIGDTDDYNIFWENVKKFYDDYNLMSVNETND